MSGGASVPFGVAAVFVPNTAAQLLLALCALTCAWFAAFRVWRAEWERGEQLRQRIAAFEAATIPKAHFEFDPKHYGCMHRALLGDTTEGLCIRAIAVCDSAAPLLACQGRLNGIYRRKTESDKWERTTIDDSLILNWGTLGFVLVTLQHGLTQYLDVMTINNQGKIFPYVHSWPLRGLGLFDVKEDFYRFDLVLTGGDSQLVLAAMSLQLHQTHEWDKPEMRVLAASELEIA